MAAKQSSEALYESPNAGARKETKAAEGDLAVAEAVRSRAGARTPFPRFTSNGDGAREVVDYSIGAAAGAETAVDLHKALRLPSQSTVGAAAKRALDIVVSALAVILLIPFWIAIAIAIKLDTHGPVLFRQKRVGRNGRAFRMLKFRTMVDGADARKKEITHLNEAGDGLFKIPRDPRMTTVGRFLRATCLDELPQLLHVLIGQMSLVGPRPLVPDEDERIRGSYRRRLTMRPGITGVWQATGASRWIPLREMAALDREYVDNWSLWLDLAILWRTVPLVFQRSGI
jgi:lipopolysaccharide/colanic/teichoic acid biosynthesis glycosyltransferase